MSTTQKLSRQELIDGVRAHARKHYGEKGTGWDILEECWTDADIDATMGVRTKSVLGAVQMISQCSGIHGVAEARDEAISAGE